MPHHDSDDVRPFDPLAIMGCFPKLRAYAIALAVPRITLDDIHLTLFGAALSGSFCAVLSLWVFLRRGNFHKDSSRLAACRLFFSTARQRARIPVLLARVAPDPPGVTAVAPSSAPWA